MNSRGGDEGGDFTRTSSDEFSLSSSGDRVSRSLASSTRETVGDFVDSCSREESDSGRGTNPWISVLNFTNRSTNSFPEESSRRSDRSNIFLGLS